MHSKFRQQLVCQPLRARGGAGIARAFAPGRRPSLFPPPAIRRSSALYTLTEGGFRHATCAAPSPSRFSSHSLSLTHLINGCVDANLRAPTVGHLPLPLPKERLCLRRHLSLFSGSEMLQEGAPWRGRDFSSGGRVWEVDSVKRIVSFFIRIKN